MLSFNNTTPSQAIDLGYDAVTSFLPPTPGNYEYLRQAAADLERDGIPHAIVQSTTGKLALYRAPREPLPTEHRRPQSRPPQARRPQDLRSGDGSSPSHAPSPKSRRPQDPAAGAPSAPPAPAPELLAQALRLAATRNAYAATQLRGFDTLVLTTAAKEWDRLGFRCEFLRLINLELKRRRDYVAIGRSHLIPAAA